MFVFQLLMTGQRQSQLICNNFEQLSSLHSVAMFTKSFLTCLLQFSKSSQILFNQ